jgi:S1-C subfamily serine protease
MLLVQGSPIDAETTPTPVLSNSIPQSVHQLAQAITVKVFSGSTWGSGVIIRRQGQAYTVLTNDHVLFSGNGNSYRIQTADGQFHLANVLKVKGGVGKKDIGLLKFYSRKTYVVAELERAEPLAGDEVFAAGFPFNTNGFVCTMGNISLLLDKALEGGYQIGYTNDIHKGMSGGPLLNKRGHLVGINGRHAYPLWGNGYIFEDGSVPSHELQAQLIQLSWALPLKTILATEF